MVVTCELSDLTLTLTLTLTPQVVVTFELNEEMVLLVTAHDRIDDQCKSLVIKDRLPTPPRERPGSGGL